MKQFTQRTKARQSFKPNTNYDQEMDEEYGAPKKWFEIAEDPKTFSPVTEQVLIEMKDEAKQCHNSECSNQSLKNKRTNTNYQFIQTIMSKGTVTDKIAAHTLAIQDNPVSSLETIRSLVNMVKVGKKKECTIVIDTLTDLFLTSLLRPDQKLKSFHQRPLSLLNDLTSGNAITRRKLLSVWYFEDQLKEVYTSFVLALNNVAHDTIDNNKEKALGAMYKLLAGNPEQEKNLLAYIVNKLGDPSQQVASKTIYCLGQLLYKHLNMQEVVLLEVEKLLFRPNISTKAQYYGVCFLSQYYLSHDTLDVARRLMEVYFSFFKACIKKGEVDSRMMSALLMGVNRAYPYAKLENEKISGHIDTIYKVVHVANFNVGLHALTLLYQVSDYTNDFSDRFYSALYKKLIDPTLCTSTHQAMLLNLLYKALLKDKEVLRVKVFIKRLLELALFVQPPFACGVLFLVSQLFNKNQNLRSLTLKQLLLNGFEDDDDEEKYNDIKDEDDVKNEETNEIDDQDIATQHVEIDKSYNDDDNIKSDDGETKPDVEILSQSFAKTSWDHSRTASKLPKNSRFNPLSRNPLYAGGEFCVYSELIYLKNHYHPTVALYATQLVDGDKIKYAGDPLQDFTLIRFLDRFVFKNPKKLEQGSGQGAHPTFGKRKTYKPKGVRALPINSASYLNESERNIPVDELFMFSFLQRKHIEKKSNEDDDSDLESVQSEEFEEMLDKMAGLPKDDEDLDFMNDIEDTLKTQKTKKGKTRVADQDDEDDSEEDDISLGGDEDDLSGDDDDLDMNDNDKELLDDLDDDEDDDEDIEFNDNLSDEDNAFTSKKKKVKGKKDDINSLFASADEFAALLEEEGVSKVKPGGSNAFENKDNSNNKQLDWEDKRNRWLTGYNNAIGKGGKNQGKKRFGSQRGQASFGNKNKKIKK